MKKQTFKILSVVTILTLAFAACKKDNAPVPDEQELITTVKLTVTSGSTFNKEFIYKVENGFTSGTPGIIQIDTVALPAGQTYNAALTVMNEKADPVEDITEEILEKDQEHLFLFLSEPSTGAGSLIVSDGSKDRDGKPFNQTFKISAAAAGTGKFTIYLMHDPVNKAGTTPALSGGETDAQVTFPVLLQ